MHATATGFGLVNSIDMPGTASKRIGFGGGGVWAQFDWAPDWPVHPTSGVFLGGGSVGHDTDGSSRKSSGVFLIVPELGVDVPIVSFLRVGVSAQYRFASGLDLPGLDNADVSGPAGALYAKFGSF